MNKIKVATQLSALPSTKGAAVVRHLPMDYRKSYIGSQQTKFDMNLTGQSRASYGKM